MMVLVFSFSKSAPITWNVNYKAVVVMFLFITLKPALAPDCRSDSMFPGSKYAMLIKNPGPVKAQSLRKLNTWKERQQNLNNNVYTIKISNKFRLIGQQERFTLKLIKH